MTLPITKATLLFSSAALTVSGCSSDGRSDDQTQQSATRAASIEQPAATASNMRPAPLASASVAAAPITSKESEGDKAARAVLRTWAQALERGEFDRAWDQFRRPPASREAYSKWWSRYRTITVALGPGTGGGAAGSIYYTAPAVLAGTTTSGEPFRLQGEVILRRVNDVPGATPDQLRWRLESADLKEAAP